MRLKDLAQALGDIRISIHAPVKGATDAAGTAELSKWYFNPRTREGCDTNPCENSSQEYTISIHAPVKGATEVYDNNNVLRVNFNPRTREGCD